VAVPPKEQSKEEYEAFLAERCINSEQWKQRIMKNLLQQGDLWLFPCQAEGNSLHAPGNEPIKNLRNRKIVDVVCTDPVKGLVVFPVRRWEILLRRRLFSTPVRLTLGVVPIAVRWFLAVCWCG